MGDDVFPDRDMDHLEKISWMVETNGWCAEPVPPREDPPTPGYTYTVGFQATYGHPEVVIFGLQPVAARGLLQLLADQLDAGSEIPEGVFVGLLDNDLRCALLTLVDVDDAMFPSAVAFTGDAFMIDQFVWPDRSGLLPWEEGYDPRLRLAQPILAD